MASEKDKSTAIDPKALIEAIRNLSPEDQRALAVGAGLAPSTIGMTPEHLQVLMGTMTEVSAKAQKEALRSQRKENPLYPERSVFNPRGAYDDNGHAQTPKVKFRIPTYFQDVRLGGELETEEEIELCNRITQSKSARDGQWTADVEGEGRNQRLLIRVGPRGHKLNLDDRMVLPPFTMILRELLDGPAAVNTENLHATIAAMQAQIDALTKAKAGAAA